MKIRARSRTPRALALRYLLFVGLSIAGLCGAQTCWKEPPPPRQSEVPAPDPALRKLTAYYMACNGRIWPELAAYQAAHTIRAAGKHKLDLELLVGVVITESHGNPLLTSSQGAKGPGQVRFAAHGNRFTQVTTERDRYDPAKNLDCAAELLAEYIGRYGVEGGLQVYNLGETAYRRGSRTSRYVSKVLSNAHNFAKYTVS